MTEVVRCRYGQFSDIPAVITMWKEIASLCFHSTTTRCDHITIDKVKLHIKQKIKEDYRNLIVVEVNSEQNSQLIGFIFGYLFTDPIRVGTIANIDSIFVNSNYRKRGIGSTLINSFLDDAKERGATEINLYVNNDNPASSLYKKLGFQNWQITMRREL